MQIELIDGFYKFKCPHCSQEIEVKKGETNCKIFRCGVLKSNMQQISPHLGKSDCDHLAATGKIHGCGKPFRLTNNLKEVEICGYI